MNWPFFVVMESSRPYLSQNMQAQIKLNGRLHVLVIMLKINNLITQDYVNNNHPVSTLSDAAQQMDYQSIQILTFNFASCTFAYQRLAQSLSRSLSAFSSFLRECLDKAIKVDQCAQYVDDIGMAANDSPQLCINFKTVFQCIRKSSLKLTMAKFWAQASRLFGTNNHASRSFTTN